MDIFTAIKKRDTAFFKTPEAKQGIDLADKNGMTPLMIAVDEKNIEAVKWLIENGADINATDKFGQTAVMLAAGRNFLGAIKALVNARAKLSLISKSGLTALGMATDNGNSEAARILKKAGGA